MADSSSGLTWKTLNGRGTGSTINGFNLPTRSSKLIARMVKTGTIAIQGSGGAISRTIVETDFENTLAHDPGLYAAGLTDFIYVELKGRASGGGPLRKRFLMNPNTISIHNDFRDSEAMGRGGWQVGVWGEMGTVSLSGQTAGRYFAGRLVDTNSSLSASYRDLQDIVAVYENNGVFYEGEAASSSPIPLTAARKQIKCHADVTLAFGNFLWDGYFIDLRVDDAADKPWASKFTISFQILRERFARSSPWQSSLVPQTRYRGHAWELCNKAAEAAQQSNVMTQTSTLASTLNQANLTALGILPRITVVN